MFENIKYFKIIFYIFKYLLKIIFICSALFLIILNICHHKTIENNQRCSLKTFYFLFLKIKNILLFFWFREQKNIFENQTDLLFFVFVLIFLIMLLIAELKVIFKGIF